MHPWLELSERDPDTLSLAWGIGGEPAGSARLSGWARLREVCRRTQRRSESVGWTFLDLRVATEARALEEQHAQALAAAWNAIETALPTSFARASFASVRGPELLELPVGALVAAAHPRRISEGTLPFDAHPALRLTGPEYASRLAELPLPRAGQLTLLLGDDLGQGAYLSQAAPEGQRLAITPEGLAETLAFGEWRQRAMIAAETAGVRVVQGFTVEAFITEVLEAPRPFLMIAAHLEPSSSETDGGVACSDGLVRLPQLFELMSGIAREGARLPLASVDLLLCSAAEQLASCFFAAGLLATNSATSLIPSGKLLVLLSRLFERNLLDGNRAFQHAWAASALSDTHLPLAP
jgi:hypothetical protein